MFTDYEDMKGDKKCKNGGGLGGWGHPRSSETSPFDRTHMTSYSTLIETMRLSILDHFRVRVFSVESGQFLPTPLAFVAPTGGDPVRILP